MAKVKTDHARPYVVVLTGGIASGKTAVSDRFALLGVPIVDTDVIAHELVAAGQEALSAIAQEFGPGILNSKGELDRRAMRERIFSDPESKKKLEAILHPRIADAVQDRIAALNADYCIVVVPLLVESGRYQWANRVLVVDVDKKTQLNRLMARDQSSRDQAHAILNAQASRQQRLELADDIITNEGSLENLDTSVQSLHKLYTQQAIDHAGR